MGVHEPDPVDHPKDLLLRREAVVPCSSKSMRAYWCDSLLDNPAGTQAVPTRSLTSCF